MLNLHSHKYTNRGQSYIIMGKGQRWFSLNMTVVKSDELDEAKISNKNILQLYLQSIKNVKANNKNLMKL